MRPSVGYVGRKYGRDSPKIIIYFRGGQIKKFDLNSSSHNLKHDQRKLISKND